MSNVNVYNQDTMYEQLNAQLKETEMLKDQYLDNILQSAQRSLDINRELLEFGHDEDIAEIPNNVKKELVPLNAKIEQLIKDNPTLADKLKDNDTYLAMASEIGLYTYGEALTDFQKNFIKQNKFDTEYQSILDKFKEIDKNSNQNQTNFENYRDITRKIAILSPFMEKFNAPENSEVAQKLISETKSTNLNPYQLYQNTLKDFDSIKTTLALEQGVSKDKVGILVDVDSAENRNIYNNFTKQITHIEKEPVYFLGVKIPFIKKDVEKNYLIWNSEEAERKHKILSTLRNELINNVANTEKAINVLEIVGEKPVYADVSKVVDKAKLSSEFQQNFAIASEKIERKQLKHEINVNYSINKIQQQAKANNQQVEQQEGEKQGGDDGREHLTREHTLPNTLKDIKRAEKTTPQNQSTQNEAPFQSFDKAIYPNELQKNNLTVEERITKMNEKLDLANSFKMNMEEVRVSKEIDNSIKEYQNINNSNGFRIK